MYWIYLVIFVLVILTPKIVHEGLLFLHEEDVESLLIFFLGLLGFGIYLAKEKALLRAFREKLHLQKQTNIISRDLSDSYSYIGEMNRKFDIVKDLIFNFPRNADELLGKKDADFYSSILEATRLLAKSDHVSLRFVDYRAGTVEKVCEAQSTPAAMFEHFDGKCLLGAKKYFWEENGYVVVRSPRSTPKLASYLIFPKATNRIEDVEVFKILAAEALFLYCVEKRIAVPSE